MSLVSVILPVFNAERTIRRAAQSILDQTWNQLELIVINDGSTDGTLEILKSIWDPRVKIISTEQQGVAAAANLALEHCSGDLIARMDSDDFSYPNRIEKQVQLLEQSGFDAVGCQVRILQNDHRCAKTMQRYENWINKETLTSEQIRSLRFVEYPLVNPTILAKRRFFELGYRAEKFPEDYDLFLRAAHQGFQFGKVPEVHFDWYDLPGGLTRTNELYSVFAFDSCRKHHLLRGPLANSHTVDVWGAGKTGKAWLKWLELGSISVRRLYDVSPRKIGQTIHGCTVEDLNALEHLDSTPLLIAVGREGARNLILGELANKGYRPGVDAWFVA